MALSPFQQHVLLWLFLHQLWPLYKIKQSYWRYERTLLDMFSSKERVGKERDSQRKRGVTVLSHRKLNLQPPTQPLSQFCTWHALSMYITPCVARYLRNNKISNKPLRVRSFLVDWTFGRTVPSQTQQSLRMLLPESGANSCKIPSIPLMNRRRHLHHHGRA